RSRWLQSDVLLLFGLTRQHVSRFSLDPVVCAPRVSAFFDRPVLPCACIRFLPQERRDVVTWRRFCFLRGCSQCALGVRGLGANRARSMSEQGSQRRKRENARHCHYVGRAYIAWCNAPALNVVPVR